ncbi:MAG: hypothetical protein ACQEWG_16375 [Bacteroidota bacterium]
MKNYIPIILLLISFSFQSCAQNENWEEHLNHKESAIHQFDIDFIRYAIDEELEDGFKDQEKFKFLNSFSSMYAIKDESLLKSGFMNRPNNDELLSLYLRRKIGWNTKQTNRAVVYKELEIFPSIEELLAFYYSGIFIQVLNNQKTFNPNGIDLNFNSLGLNKLEGDIMFLSAMRHCGSQIQSYSDGRFPETCHRAIEFVLKLPTFNGKSFEHYKLSSFDDFLIHVDKRYPKMSFKERYLPDYEGAKAGYLKCQNVENRN